MLTRSYETIPTDQLIRRYRRLEVCLTFDPESEIARMTTLDAMFRELDQRGAITQIDATE